MLAPLLRTCEAITIEENAIMTRQPLPEQIYLDAARQALTRPPAFGYFGPRDELFSSWGLLPFTQHRDSGTVDRSNYRTILAALTEAAGTCSHPDLDPSELVDDMRASCWLHGWREHIMCRVLITAECGLSLENLTPVFRTAVEIAGALQDYAVFSEDDLGRLESEESHDAFDSVWQGIDWSAVAPNHGDEGMKDAVYESLTQVEWRDGFSDDEIIEAVVDWAHDQAREEDADTYKDQLPLFDPAALVSQVWPL